MANFRDPAFWRMAYYTAGIFVIATVATIVIGMDPMLMMR